MRSLEGATGWQEERDELAQIAHLYFSGQKGGEAASCAPSAAHEDLLPILFASAEEESRAAVPQFLVRNLALILHIRNVPVTVVGSRAGLKGFWFQRAIEATPVHPTVGRITPAETFYGPAGIVVHRLDGPPCPGTAAPLAYRSRRLEPAPPQGVGEPPVILTDHKEWFFAHAPPRSLVVFALSPRSGESVLSEISRLERRACTTDSTRWGVVILGCSTEEEARVLHRVLSTRIEEVFRRPLSYCGFLPGGLSSDIECSLRWPYVLCQPLTRASQCLKEIARLIYPQRRDLPDADLGHSPHLCRPAVGLHAP